MQKKTGLNEHLSLLLSKEKYGTNLIDYQEPRFISPHQTRKLPKQQQIEEKARKKEDKTNLNLWWLNKMATNTEKSIIEKLTLFWHGHFACRMKYTVQAYRYLNTLRKNALGNFRTLAKAMAKEPAMLYFLNGAKNRKANPNENFARELLELFTIGIGNYSEKDIKEAARAFTGWSINKKDNYRAKFTSKKHDSGIKFFLGKKGTFDGDDIIDILLEKKETARFIAAKFYCYFVNEVENERHIEELAEVFYASDYEIASLVKKIVESDWFYKPENIGNRIKSPIELIVGLMKHIKLEFAKPSTAILVQKCLTQYLFYPPNVAGWKGGQQWINNSTLMFRLNLVEMVMNKKKINFTPKKEEEVENFKRIGRLPGINYSFSPLLTMLSENRNTEPVSLLEEILFAPGLNLSIKSGIQKYEPKALIVEFFKSPQYQLC